MLIWGTLALIAGYYMGIIGILMTTPVDQIDQTIGIAKAAETISPAIGILVAACICLAVFAQATTTMNAYSRLLFIGGVEKRLPSKVASITKGKTPWVAMLIQAIVGSIIVLIFTTQSNLEAAYNLYLAALVAVWCASLFYIYFGLLKARKHYKELYAERGNDVWKIPGKNVGLALVCTVGIISNVLAIYFVFAQPWTDAMTLPVWQLWLTITSIVIIAVGILVYFVGKKNAVIHIS